MNSASAVAGYKQLHRAADVTSRAATGHGAHDARIH